MQFKNEQDKKMFFALHPALILIFADLNNYTYEKHGFNLVVTQTVSDEMTDMTLGRVSPSHREKRAIDIRTSNLPREVLRDILAYINTKKEYEKYKYLSMSGEKKLAYFHMGTNEHIHLAIHSRFAR